MDAKRDWGYAREYVDGMYRMLQHDQPDTYVLATNKTWTVRHFVELAFKAVGIDIEWKGEQEKETGIDKKTGATLVRVNPKYYRPCEVELLIGDPQKAKKLLGWEPKTSLEELCKMMVEADIRRQKIAASLFHTCFQQSSNYRW